MKAGKARLFENGEAPVTSDIQRLDTMGASVGLYFRFLKNLGIVFFCMSVLAIPSIWMCRFGGRIASEDVDAMQVADVSACHTLSRAFDNLLCV